MKFKPGDKVVFTSEQLPEGVRGVVTASNDYVTTFDSDSSPFPLVERTKNLMLEEVFDSPLVKALS